MVTLKEAVTKADLKKFVTFPFSLYQDSPYWGPPIISDELGTFDKSQNPAFQHADAWFFIAYKNGKPAGRIVAIINKTEINHQKVSKMRFGWFDFIDDTEVSPSTKSGSLLKQSILLTKDIFLDYSENDFGFSFTTLISSAVG